MALPPAKVDGKPWYEERQSWWQSLGGRGQAYLITGFIFLAIWLFEAIPPIFTPSRAVGLCGRFGSCYVFPASEFALGESVLAAVFLGFGTWSWAIAVREARRNGG